MNFKQQFKSISFSSTTLTTSVRKWNLFFLNGTKKNTFSKKKFEQLKKKMEFTALNQNNQIKSLNKKLKLQTLKMQESQEKIRNGTLSKGNKNELNKKSDKIKILQKETIVLENRKPLQKEQNQVKACQDIVTCQQQSKSDLLKNGIKVNLFHLNHSFVFMPSSCIMRFKVK